MNDAFPSTGDGSPAVSVIMAAYNAMPYLPRAVESVLDQSYRDFECLIVNDASTDDTGDYLKSLTDPRVRLIANETNQGLAFSLNRAIDAARGRYLARMDADDICHPQRFERQVAFMDRHPDTGVVGTHFVLIDENGDTIRKVVTATRDDIIRFRMMYTFPMCHPSIMIRSKILRDHGLAYDARYRLNEDYALFIALSEHTRFAVMPDYLLRFRKHGASTTKVKARENRETKHALAVAHQRQVLGTDAAGDGDVQRFLHRYIFEDWNSDSATFEGFARGMAKLANAFADARADADRKHILGDAAEMLWRALLFRGKIYKHPKAALRIALSKSGLIPYLPHRVAGIAVQLLHKA